MLTPDHLQAIEARLAAATPGPWFWRVGSRADCETYLMGGNRDLVMDFVRRGMQRAIARFNVGDIMRKADDLAVPLKGQEHNAAWNSTLTHPDASLIAHAPTDLRATLDEIARLRELVKAAYEEGQRDYGANCVREKDVMPIVRSWRNSAARKRLEGGGA